uniref:Uncharacterized protein n=1 Tax=Arundo donax TaxID=35708 RepID=A0A0A9FPP9_ARUDO
MKISVASAKEAYIILLPQENLVCNHEKTKTKRDDSSGSRPNRTE